MLSSSLTITQHAQLCPRIGMGSRPGIVPGSGDIIRIRSRDNAPASEALRSRTIHPE